MAQAMLHFVFPVNMKLDHIKRLFYVKAVINGNIESALQVINK